MKQEKKFTTFDEQIKILKERNLIFLNEEGAIDALRRYGYYSIINGYKDAYAKEIDGVEKYEEVSFEQIFSLFILDRKIRSAVMNAMLEVEDNLKSATAHIIAEYFGSNASEYLNRKNYKTGKAKIGKNLPIDDLMKKLENVLNDEKIEPIKYYKSTYKNVPPWILFKGASLGNIVNLIKLQKPEQKVAIISLVYNIPRQLADRQEIKDLFMDTIFVCLDFRNCVAHGGRTYNHKGKSSFRYSDLLHSKMNINQAEYRIGKGVQGLIPLISALEFFDNKNISKDLQQVIQKEALNHLQKYPKDSEYLSNYLPYIQE